jgi:hypothetical protein
MRGGFSGIAFDPGGGLGHYGRSFGGEIAPQFGVPEKPRPD